MSPMSRKTLSRKSSDLRSLAQSRGMGEEEIERSISKALSTAVVPEKPRGGASLRGTCRLLVWAMLALIAGTVVARALLELTWRSRTFGPTLTSFSLVWLTPTMRLLRKVFLPLHSPAFNLSYYHYEDCVLSNPFYTPRDVRCEACRDISGFKKPKANRLMSIGHFRAFPIICRDMLPSYVNLEKIQTFVKEHEQDIDIPTTRSTITSRWASTILDLKRHDAERMIREEPDFVLHWTSYSLRVGRLLRGLFPRTKALPPGVETVVVKTLLLHGSRSSSFLTPLRRTPLVYMQGWSSRNLTLVPSPSCRHVCSPLSLVLHPKDIAVFNPEVYTSSIGPVQDENDISVGLLVHIQ